MLTDDLTRLMHTAEAAEAGRPMTVDPAAVRRRGRRRRTTRRLVTTGCTVALLAAVVGAGSSLVGGGTDVDRGAGVAAQDHHVTGISRYERRVLAQVPEAYAVDGTVIVPGAPDDHSDANQRLAPGRVVGAVRALPFHAYSQVGYVGSTYPYPRLLQGNLPRGSQVLADNGPVSLTCTTWPGQDDCTVSIVWQGDDGSYFYQGGLGSDRFLQPGAPMQLFLGGSYTAHRYRDTVIGGFDGTDATRVALRLVDGRTVDADLDTGHVHPGDTLFWATTSAAVASVTAYDHDGGVVVRHEVRSCSGGVDCEVR